MPNDLQDPFEPLNNAIFGTLDGAKGNNEGNYVEAVKLILADSRFQIGTIKKDFPSVLLTLRSGSISLVKERLNSFKPVKTESTTNSAIAPTITPILAIPLIILIALFLLLLKIYRLAM